MNDLNLLWIDEKKSSIDSIRKKMIHTFFNTKWMNFEYL